ncbi:MAG: PqqD family protein [Betaproteobacteria bacterium]|nr:PqqD family protein [Betaproteobacteria bacterium]
MKVSIPDSVLSTELHDEGVLLNLETGEYFGLDSVGMEMWKLLRANGDVGAARAALLEQYDVAEDVLAKDLDELIAKLAERKLLVVADE